MGYGVMAMDSGFRVKGRHLKLHVALRFDRTKAVVDEGLDASGWIRRCPCLPRDCKEGSGVMFSLGGRRGFVAVSCGSFHTARFVQFESPVRSRDDDLSSRSCALKSGTLTL